MKILVTGAAGFIGSHVSLYLLARGDDVVGLDNLNDYYDPTLKQKRLDRIAAFCDGRLNDDIYPEIRTEKPVGRFTFRKLDLADRDGMAALFAEEKFDRVVHLAAQAGVRYSIDDPFAYVDSNITGFLTVLEGCRNHKVEHLVYASTSSVYGSNTHIPFTVSEPADHPVAFYGATKRANELMAHSYSHLFALPTTGLRFFTVYGPWGRPDMALFKFTKAILEDQPSMCSITAITNGISPISTISLKAWWLHWIMWPGPIRIGIVTIPPPIALKRRGGCSISAMNGRWN